jgi:hypothetical protein
MEVIEALRTSILEPRDHLHINHERTFAGIQVNARSAYSVRLSHAPWARWPLADYPFWACWY